MLVQQQDAGRGAPDGQTRTALYRRMLPGGGYVEIELDDARMASSPVRGRVILERRAEVGRRVGHAPPVVAELTGDDRDEVTAELFRLARDNPGLARSLMRWQAARERAD